jgi:phosphoribosylformylglycinamidine synthase
VNQQSPCVFTKGVESIYVPVAHGEGKFAGDLKAIAEKNIALYYTDAEGDRKAGYPFNPNGSVNNIAGICDDSGRVFGLMPHPEDHILMTQHPQWTRLGLTKAGNAFQLFRNAVRFAESI